MIISTAGWRWTGAVDLLKLVKVRKFRPDLINNYLLYCLFAVTEELAI